MTTTASRILRTWRLALAAAALAIASPRSAAAGDLICRSPDGVAGYELVKRTAEGFVGPNTRNTEGIRIYLTARGDELYMQSNFVTTMQIEDHSGHVSWNTVPTKIVVNSGFYDLPTLVSNIIGDEHLAAKYEITPSLALTVDHSVLLSPRWSLLEYERATVSLIDNTGRHWPTERMTIDGHPLRLIAFKPSLYARLKDVNLLNAANMDRLPFKKEDLHVLALVENTATIQAIDESLPGTRLSVAFDSLDISRLFSSNKNKLIVVLGHHEDDAFVIRGAHGKEILRVPDADLETQAKANGIVLVKMGCYAGASGGTGCAARFNTLDAVARLADAADASDHGEFFRRLAHKTFPWILDADRLAHSPASEPRVRFEAHTGGNGKKPAPRAFIEIIAYARVALPASDRGPESPDGGQPDVEDQTSRPPTSSGKRASSGCSAGSTDSPPPVTSLIVLALLRRRNKSALTDR